MKQFFLDDFLLFCRVYCSRCLWNFCCRIGFRPLYRTAVLVGLNFSRRLLLLACDFRLLLDVRLLFCRSLVSLICWCVPWLFTRSFHLTIGLDVFAHIGHLDISSRRLFAALCRIYHFILWRLQSPFLASNAPSTCARVFIAVLILVDLRHRPPALPAPAHGPHKLLALIGAHIGSSSAIDTTTASSGPAAPSSRLLLTNLRGFLLLSLLRDRVNVHRLGFFFAVFSIWVLGWRWVRVGRWLWRFLFNDSATRRIRVFPLRKASSSTPLASTTAPASAAPSIASTAPSFTCLDFSRRITTVSGDLISLGYAVNVINVSPLPLFGRWCAQAAALPAQLLSDLSLFSESPFPLFLLCLLLEHLFDLAHLLHLSVFHKWLFFLAGFVLLRLFFPV